MTAFTPDHSRALESAIPEAAPVAQPTAQPVPVKPAFPPPAGLPTQTGPHGILFDFNDGARVIVPPEDGHTWRVRLRDLATDVTVYETALEGGYVGSSKRFFVPFQVQVWRDEEQVLDHRYSAEGKPILIQFPVGTLGDMIAWFTYADRFQKKHGCKLTCAMAPTMIELFGPVYPDITFVTHEQVKPETFYATYNVGLFFHDKDCNLQPTDFRFVGLHRTAGYILGVDPSEEAPKIHVPDLSRPIPEKYVVVAAQSTTQAKYWNHPTGWLETVKHLKEQGYRVICIDQKAVHGQGNVWNQIPHGCENETGDRPLAERARWLKHAEFFIGLSSGLSWLAWAMGTRVVLISGFTHPTNEFFTPWRIINWHTCNSCWNDPALMFDHQNFMWCPRHAGTPRQFECTRLIQPGQVIGAIKTIPVYAERPAAQTAPVIAPAPAPKVGRPPVRHTRSEEV